MDLDFLVNEIRNFEGVKRKRPIGTVVDILREGVDRDDKVLASFGEDAGVLDMGNGRVVLLATDSIWGKIVKVDPWWAGYCAAIANVNDILAMGGRPTAMVDVISVQEVDFCKEVARGIKEGTEKYGIPLVGGHLHPDSDYNAVDVAMIGEADKEMLIYSHTAQPGDRIIYAVDLKGRLYPSFHLNWDSITMRSKEEIKEQMNILTGLGGLVTSGKDVSNPGVIGTLGMLCESSRVGALVDLREIPRPEEVELHHWLKVYPGFGFLLTTEEDNVASCLDRFLKKGIAAKDIGMVDGSYKVKISDGRGSKVVFDLEADHITGL